jgi:enoyl-CoA hydratase/carnithine racemase
VKFKGNRISTMDDIVTERAGSILRIQLNRPTKRNAMTSAMYLALAAIFNEAANDEDARVVLWHGAGDSFCAGNDIEDFLKNPPGPGASPQAGLMNALVNFDKPLVAAVHGAAIGGGTTMLTHCDFVYAGESAQFQLPFINLALVPEFGSSCSVPARVGHVRAAELILLGVPFGARRAAELGLVTQIVSDRVQCASPLRRRKGGVQRFPGKTQARLHGGQQVVGDRIGMNIRFRRHVVIATEESPRPAVSPAEGSASPEHGVA